METYSEYKIVGKHGLEKFRAIGNYCRERQFF